MQQCLRRSADSGSFSSQSDEHAAPKCPKLEERNCWAKKIRGGLASARANRYRIVSIQARQAEILYHNRGPRENTPVSLMRAQAYRLKTQVSIFSYVLQRHASLPFGSATFVLFGDDQETYVYLRPRSSFVYVCRDSLVRAAQRERCRTRIDPLSQLSK